MKTPKFRCSLSVVNFKKKIKGAWKIEEWQGKDDPVEHVLFFGLYTIHDYDAWWYLSEKVDERSVFWCGSDVLNLLGNTEFQRRIKLYPNAKHYCETKEEYDNLKSVGVEAEIIPSFLGDENEFVVSYRHSENPHIWMCAHPGREVEYGVDYFVKMAQRFPDYTFHIYGIYDWLEVESPKNIIYHGQVEEDQLNKEIRQYQCGFRGNTHEGLSEVIVKSLLMGQYCASRMKFPYTWNYQTEEELENLLKKLKEMKHPNREGRGKIKGSLNKFPWLGTWHQIKETIKEF